MTKRLNISSGQNFHNWTVIHEVLKNNKRYWLCRCVCGTEKAIIQSSLVSGNSKSCGCLKSSKKVTDLTGNKFGRLTVIKQSHKEKNRIVWTCKCDCGQYVNIKGIYLTTGQTKSCGCLKRDQIEVNLRDKYNDQYVDDVNTSLLTSKLREDSSSGVKGVSQHKASGKWDAYITVNKRRIHLGRYLNKQDAVQKRREAEEKYHKPYIDAKD